MLSGYKTYISSGLIILFSVLFALGLIEGETFLKLLGIFMGLGLASLRVAVGKIK